MTSAVKVVFNPNTTNQANAYKLDKSRKLSFGKELTLSNVIPTFNDPEKDTSRNHCGIKEKMLITTMFSFSHNVFYPSQSKFQFFGHVYLVVCKRFEIEPVWYFVVW